MGRTHAAPLAAAHRGQAMADMVLSASTACFAGASMARALGQAAALGLEAVELTLWGEGFHSVGKLPGLWWRETGEA